MPGKQTILDVPSAHERFMAVEGKPSNHVIARERQLADVLLAPSDYVGDVPGRGGDPEHRILKIPYGVDPQTFQRQTASRADECSGPCS